MFQNGADGLCYKSEKYEYSLLEGITSKGDSSDIVFIFREPTYNDIEDGFTGEVVSFVYGGFDNLKFVEQKIKEYEQMKGE